MLYKTEDHECRECNFLSRAMPQNFCTLMGLQGGFLLENGLRTAPGRISNCPLPTTSNAEALALLIEIREWLTGGESEVSAIEIAHKINAVLQPNICREPRP